MKPGGYIEMIFAASSCEKHRYHDQQAIAPIRSNWGQRNWRTLLVSRTLAIIAAAAGDSIVTTAAAGFAFTAAACFASTAAGFSKFTDSRVFAHTAALVGSYHQRL